MQKPHFILSSLLLLIGLSQCTTPINENADSNESAILEASEKANQFFDDTFDEQVDRSPQFQTRLGIKKDYGKWDDPSEAFVTKEYEIAKANLKRLNDSIILENLDEPTQLSYQLFRKSLEKKISSYQYRYHNYPINQMFGFHADVPAFLINFHRIDNEEDAKAYIERINGVDELFNIQIENLKTRESKGIVLPKFLFWRVIEASENVIAGQPFDDSADASAIWEDFQKKIEGLSLEEDRKSELISSCKDALLETLQPAYKSLIDFLTQQEKIATNDAGAWKFPEGETFYGYALNNTTTTDYTAEEIHEIGLSEVARIHKEMEGIMKKVNFEGGLKDFFQFMATDKQFYFDETEEAKQIYLDSATFLIENMEKQLDALFITKPKSNMIVKRVEAFREKSGGKAFYNSPAPDGSRPGIYYVNLYKMADMPTYEMEALAYHEGIPGHHMQRAIAQELQNVPKFRKFASYTAYTEGWALYCEAIPKEIGLYQNPYADFGRLAMELWRACRLVVDTGIHHKKWNREQGIAYYSENTPASEDQCIKMVERHIVMPSQATAYKIGMIKIMELRQKAKDSLGEKFDVREFHDIVLTSGAVPLDILENQIDIWIASKAV